MNVVRCCCAQHQRVHMVTCTTAHNTYQQRSHLFFLEARRTTARRVSIGIRRLRVPRHRARIRHTRQSYHNEGAAFVRHCGRLLL
jgi:hypothetical protein